MKWGNSWRPPPNSPSPFTGGEAETGKGPVDLFPAERAHTILVRPGREWSGETHAGCLPALPPPLRGRDRVVVFFNACTIASTTVSVSRSTSLLQKRSTRKSCETSHLSRNASLLVCSACCPPSTSTINRTSRQTKSAMYIPRGSCLRNLYPLICCLLNRDHRQRSVSVKFLRSVLARWVFALFPITPPPILFPAQGTRESCVPVRRAKGPPDLLPFSASPRKGRGTRFHLKREGAHVYADTYKSRFQDPISALTPSPPGCPSAPRLNISISPCNPGLRY